jgi:hypothetical protein
MGTTSVGYFNCHRLQVVAQRKLARLYEEQLPAEQGRGEAWIWLSLKI